MENLQGILIVLITVVVVAFTFILPGLMWKHNVEKNLRMSNKRKWTGR